MAARRKYHREPPSSVCYSTIRAEPHCTAWVEAGHPFHGCDRRGGHTQKGPKKDRPHHCPCGKEWSYRDVDRSDRWGQ